MVARVLILGSPYEGEPTEGSSRITLHTGDPSLAVPLMKGNQLLVCGREID